MTLDELIQQLEDLREEFSGEIPVRLAFQPRWALQFEIGRVEAAFTGEAELEAEAAPCIYIGEGASVADSPYLPGDAASALGWS